MKLTQDQIQELYNYTRKHYVEHYDLQTELVDHLANGIEQLWEQQPNVSFETAKELEFKKFGIFGFMDVVEERKKAMEKKYRAILWRYFKQWWSFPKMVGLILAIAAVFTVLNFIPKGDFKFGSVAGVFFALALLMFIRAYQLKKRVKVISRKWMLQQMIYEQGFAVQLFFLPVHFLNLANNQSLLQSTYGQLLAALLTVIMAIALKICGYTIPSKAEELLAQTYPEYKFQEKV